MPAPSRAALSLLALTGIAALPCGHAPSAADTPRLLPVTLTVPADGAVIDAEGQPLAVKLGWRTPQEPVPVRFFVEVVAVEQAGPHEIFAGYVDQPTADVHLTDDTAEYAWRVYTVGRDVPAYALSGWQHFSLRAAQ